MQAEIHPKYEAVTATCSCGNKIQTRSTLAEDFHVDVCSKCHPFFTGKQKVLDSGGRVDRFKKRFVNEHFSSKNASFMLAFLMVEPLQPRPEAVFSRLVTQEAFR